MYLGRRERPGLRDTPRLSRAVPTIGGTKTQRPRALRKDVVPFWGCTSTRFGDLRLWVSALMFHCEVRSCGRLGTSSKGRGYHGTGAPLPPPHP